MSELIIWGHAQSSAHPVLFSKHRRIVVFLPPGLREFSIVYLSCSTVGSPGGEFNSYKSKRLRRMGSISH